MRRIEQLETQLRECKAQLSKMAEEKEEISKVCDKMKVQQLTRDAETIRLKTLIVGKCKDIVSWRTAYCRKYLSF